MPERLFFASKWFFLESAINFYLKILSREIFSALQVSFEQFYYAFAMKLDKAFWAEIRQKTFLFLGKRLERLERRKFCVLSVQKF